MSEKARMMTLEEVESCEFAYLIYEEDDTEVHCFLRLKTFRKFITFARHLNAWTTSQPCLWKEYYGSRWVAYTARPEPYQIRAHKQIMYNKGSEPNP